MNRPGFAFVTGIILAQCAVMGKELPDVEVLEKFALFTKKYSTPYEDAMEGTFRVGAFADNLKFMDQKIKKGHMKGYLPPPTDLVQDTPVELNWAERGAVNSPMDQGDCNSCYAIVTLGVLEAAFWKATGSLARFSIQQVIDCSEMEGNEGCLHGNRGDTLQYIVNYGIVSDGDYPYRQMESDCNAVVDDRSKQCLQAHDLDEDDVTVIQENKLSQLFQALQEGPLAVQVDVTPKQWKSYKGGILESFKCDGEADHGVLLVGYGIENGKSYWIIRNSWGTGWGEGGYARLHRDPTAEEGPGFCNIMQHKAIGVSFKRPLKSEACRER